VARHERTLERVQRDGNGNDGSVWGVEGGVWGVRGHVGGGACMFAGRRLQLRCRRGLSMRWRGFQSNRSAGARTCNKMPSQFDKSRATIRTRCRCVACGWAAAGEGHQRTLGVLMLFKKCQGQAASILWRSRMQKYSDCTALHTSNLLSFAVSQPSCPLPPTARASSSRHLQTISSATREREEEDERGALRNGRQSDDVQARFQW
jgi:putative component of toxin-antitoxin plasmid stabilization module